MDKKMPEHIAFIMDGNGRWAKKRLLPRTTGHKVGVDALKKVIEYCNNIGIKYVSIFAFSTENWNRPKEEVAEIFRLIKEMLSEETKNFIKQNIRFTHMGSLNGVPKDLADEITNSVNETKNCKGLTFNVCFNYGGKADIVQAVNRLLKERKKSVSEEEFDKYLYCSDIPAPDIICRTSGEKRISNFMLWQMAYSEFVFIDEFWPDVNKKVVDKVILEYNRRNRRYGTI